jgi:hypothetical protein
VVLPRPYVRKRTNGVSAQLPPNFFGSLDQLMDADLLIVMGTSLTVHPFASLINMVKGKCPRVLINLDAVGGVGSSLNDLVFLGKCDDIIRDLAKELGWEEELDREWMRTATSLDTHEAAPSKPPKAKDQTDGTKLDLEIERIIERVEDSLVVSKKDKAAIEEAEVSIRPSGETSEEMRDNESVTSPPETPQKDEGEGSKSPKKDNKGGEHRSRLSLHYTLTCDPQGRSEFATQKHVSFDGLVAYYVRSREMMLVYAPTKWEWRVLDGVFLQITRNNLLNDVTLECTHRVISM